MSIFTKDYESSGTGISKNEERKKGLALFFDILGRKFWSLMWLNALYILFFIPLFLIWPAIYFIENSMVIAAVVVLLLLVFAIGIGPATAGMMKVMRRFYIEKPAFIAKDFFEGVKVNFKKAAVISLADALILLSAYASLNVYPALAAVYSTKLFYVPMVITFSLFLVVMIMNYYLFIMLSTTNLSLKDLYKNSFTLAIVAIKENLLTTAIIGVVIYGMLILMLNVFQVFALLIPIFPMAFLGLVVCFNCYPVIQKYVIDPYYTSQGKMNPDYLYGMEEDEDIEPVFEDMGGKETPIEKRRKTKARVIR